jgi:hypothetical protein
VFAVPPAPERSYEQITSPRSSRRDLRPRSGSLPLDVVFDRVGLLPGASCMLPRDDERLRRVTTDVVRRWPHLRPRLRRLANIAHADPRHWVGYEFSGNQPRVPGVEVA